MACLDTLLKQGTNVNIEDRYGNTALHKAAFEAHRACAEYLLGVNASIFATNHEGATPMHKGTSKQGSSILAAESGRVEMIDLLVEHAKGVDIVNVYDTNGNSPLHLAAKRGTK